LLAVAHGPRVALVPLSPRAPPTAVAPHGVPSPGPTLPGDEAVTAAAFCAFAGPARGAAPAAAAPADGLLLLGTSTGHLQLHPAGGGPALLRQRVGAGAVLALRARGAGAGTDPSALSDDVAIVLADAVVRVTGADLFAAAALAAGPPPRPQLAPLALAAWSLARSAGPRADAALAGPRPPGLRDALDGIAAPGGRVLILSCGAAPALAAHDGAEVAPRGALSLVADLASSVAASFYGAARAAVAGGRDKGVRSAVRGAVAAARASRDGDASLPGSRPPSAPPLPDNSSGPLPLGEAAPVWRSLVDAPTRRAATLELAPARGLAATADGLGRVMLLDAGTGLVLRVWKGVRGAQLAWLPRSGGGAPRAVATLTPPRPRGGRKRKSPDAESVAHAAPRTPLLVIYAPRRGAVDVWAPAPPGRRLASLPAGPRGRLLSPSPLFGVAASGGPGGGGADAWLLDCATGAAWSVGDAVRAALAAEGRGV
jgi:hypothetical protein